MTQTANPKFRSQARPRPQTVRRTRRIVNVRLLVISAIAAGVFALGCYAWYRHQASQVAVTLLQRATTLEKEGKSSDAVGYLGRYLQLEPSDSDGASG